MKTSLVICLLLNLLYLQAIAQQTDANGNKIHRANIALIVKEDSFKNGAYQSSNTKTNLNSVTYLWVSKILLEEGFQIVNRTGNVGAIKQLIEENKLDEYIDGWSSAAKNIGANWLLLVDLTTSIENEVEITLDYSYRFMNVENNRSFHYQTRSEFYWVDENRFRKEYQESLQQNKTLLLQVLRQHFPCLFGINSINGKSLALSACQPVGAITKEDKLYGFQYSDESKTIQGKTFQFNILHSLGKAMITGSNNGFLNAKIEQRIENTDNILFSLTSRNTLKNEQFIPVTVGGLTYDLNTIDGYLKKQINQAVYCGICKLPQLNLVESEYKAEIQEEKELQKHEDFLDGYTVQQFKSIGAMFYIQIKNFSKDKENVSFALDIIDISKNSLVNTFDVQCHKSNISDAVSHYLEQVFAWPCVIDRVDSKKVTIYSLLPIRLKEGNTQILTCIKACTNPVNNQTTFQRVKLAKLKYVEYCGMRHLYEIEEIIDKKELEVVLNKEGTNFFLFSDNKKVDLLKDNSLMKKMKVKNALKQGFKSMIRNAKIQ